MQPGIGRKRRKNRRFSVSRAHKFTLSRLRGASACCIGWAMPSTADQRRPYVSAAPRSRWRRIVPLVALALAMAIVFATGLHREFSFEALVRHRATIDAFVVGNGPRAIAVYVAIYVAATALSIPGAAILSVAGGLLFGAALGGMAAVAGATVGGTFIFLVARSAIGEWLARRAGPQVAGMLAGFRADAFSYLLFLRLVPLFPFWLVNLVAAIAGMELGSFVAATVIGMIPATFAFAFFGAGLDSLFAAQEAAYRACIAEGKPGCRLDFDVSAAATPQLIAAFVALGVVALAPVVVKRMRAKRQRTAD
jgi:uncharacterized membrane protein YdjX (TVP38/TMEM64 family)